MELGRLPTPLLAEGSPRLVCGKGGAGARLGSPPVTPGVDDDVRGGAIDDAAEESEESGLVGFLR